MTGEPVPFRIAVPDAELRDLQERLARTRWSPGMPGATWDEGTDPAYLRELVEHWQAGFDWREQERRLNAFPQFRADIGGLGVHFVHARGTGPAPIPVLLLHGWPGSFVQMLDLVPLLADPEVPTQSFDVVAASLPGFGFSDAPTAPGMSEVGMAHVFHRLMHDVLGYERYVVRGSDFGAGVAEQLAARYPGAVIAMHTGGTTPRADGFPPDPSPALQAYRVDVERWQAAEVGYSREQSTRPQTLAAALNDSPAGLASWIVEKFRRWSDCDGDVERRFAKDQLLTNIAVYWFTGTIGSSVRLYLESHREQDWRRADVPAAYLMSPKDMFRTPREWVERSARVDRWTEIDRGGHFLEWEEPALVATDLREFLAELGVAGR